MKIAPGQRAAHNALGLVMSQLGGFEAAVRQYERALQIDPGNAEVHFNLATVLARLGQTENADGEYVEALGSGRIIWRRTSGSGARFCDRVGCPRRWGISRKRCGSIPIMRGHTSISECFLMQNRAPEAIER